MSLEIAAACDRFALVVSDGLSWNPVTGRVVNEHSRKQIGFGRDIVISGGGKSKDLDALFSGCREAYEFARRIGMDPVSLVKSFFEWRIKQDHFIDFGKSILCGLLVARQDNGFLIVKRRGDYDQQEHFVKPGDEPVCLYATPTPTIESLMLMYEHEAIREPMRNGARSGQVIANLKALYYAASQIEDPPKCNENVNIDILGDPPDSEPCEADALLVQSLAQFTQQTRELLAALERKQV